MRALVVPVALLAAALAGCAAEAPAEASSEARGLRIETTHAFANGTERHRWDNPAKGAEIAWTGDVAAGGLVVHVYDGDRREVHVQGFTPTSLPATAYAQGRPGTWHVDLDYRAFEGRVALEIVPR